MQRQKSERRSDESLDYGVMVTQQILVLFFQVRVLVVQQKKEVLTRTSFFCYYHSLTDESIMLNINFCATNPAADGLMMFP